QRRDLHEQGRFLDHDSGPHAIEQFVLGEERSGAIDQRDQQVERAGAQRDGRAVLEQASRVGLQLEGAEAEGLKCSGIGHSRENPSSTGGVYARGGTQVPCAVYERSHPHLVSKTRSPSMLGLIASSERLGLGGRLRRGVGRRSANSPKRVAIRVVERL